MRFGLSWMAAAVVSLATTTALSAQTVRYQITVSGGDKALKNVPIRVPLKLAKEYANSPVQISGGGVTQGQISGPGVLVDGNASNSGVGQHELHFILPKIDAKEKVTIQAAVTALKNPPKADGFQWNVQKDFAELSYDKRPVLRYMCRPYDDSTKEARDLSYKVFHHVYDPAGKRFVTNGGPDGLFPHHRGLMFGFNKITYGKGKKADTWHCRGDDYLAHNGIVSQEAGPVLGRQRVAVDWHGSAKDVFAKEERELTAYDIPGGTLIEFATVLRTTGGDIQLDGDPQHAGFQFRASKDVAAKTKKQTYYLRPDGKGKPGATRNWPGNKEHVNLPWNAMSFVLDGQRFTAVYLPSPKNPGETRFSERDYGRFGCYFAYKLTEKNPLKLNYRIWLQDGEMTREQIENLHAAFALPPTVAVKMAK